MLIYAIIIALGNFFTAPDDIFINNKLVGYWVAIIDNSDFKAPAGEVKVLRFNKCKSKARKSRQCEYGWCNLPSHMVSNDYKLYKSARTNWQPTRSSVYWVAKKKNKESNRTVIHMIDKSEIHFDATNTELYIYQNNKLIYKLIRLH